MDSKNRAKKRKTQVKSEYVDNDLMEVEEKQIQQSFVKAEPAIVATSSGFVAVQPTSPPPASVIEPSSANGSESVVSIFLSIIIDDGHVGVK